MAIKAYCGLMGSGKTYEVVSEVILGALRQGRRVVSNIAGLDFEAMKAVLLEDGVPDGAIGELVSIPHEKVLDPLFWRTDEDEKNGVTPFINPGDVLAIDEIWRFWDGFGLKDHEGKKRPARFMNFVRMHRHFVHPESGIACDIAVITQDPADIHRSFRGVIEETYVMTKLTAVGLSSRYRVDVFQKVRITRKPLRSIQRSYNSRYFPLYKSHSQKKDGDADAREVNIDDRANILKSPAVRAAIVLALPMFIGGVWGIMNFFSPKTPQKEAEKKAETKEASSAPASFKDARPKDNDSKITDDWRVVGWYQTSSGLRVLLSNGSNSRYVTNPPVFKISAMTVEMQLPDGSFVTSFSGRKNEGSALGVGR